MDVSCVALMKSVSELMFVPILALSLLPIHVKLCARVLVLLLSQFCLFEGSCLR